MEEYLKNPDGSYMDADQIFADVIANKVTDAEDIVMFATDFNPPLTEENKKIQEDIGLNANAFARQSFGRWMRNAYGLWAEDNPHTMQKYDKSHVRDGVDHHPNHPDNYSGAIIDRLVQHYKAQQEQLKQS